MKTDCRLVRKIEIKILVELIQGCKWFFCVKPSVGVALGAFPLVPKLV